jgi:hypothetical protein
LRSIKYCKGIDYLEWVISLMSERASPRELRVDSIMRVAQISSSVAKLAELRGETAVATQPAR